MGFSPSSTRSRRWRRHLAQERAEAKIYRDLAHRRSGEEREILLALAEAEKRHEQHWVDLLGADPGAQRTPWTSTILGWMARHLGFIFVLALTQRAETRTAYHQDDDATARMAADEQIHAEVVRGLARRGRQTMSGSFRAAVFGANDGLVSNLALVLGFGATGAAGSTVLFAGLAGLLAGALSMGAGEFISVSSQRELLAANRPARRSTSALLDLDLQSNELSLVYRARGMSPQDAAARAQTVLASLASYQAHDALTSDLLRTSVPLPPTDQTETLQTAKPAGDEHVAVGTAWGAAASSFVFFAAGAVVPTLPYWWGTPGTTAIIWACALVGVVLLATGAVVGLLSGASPWWRALRQLAIGWGAAGVTYLLGWWFSVTGI